MASAGHAGSQQPAAGSSSIKHDLPVAAACSRKRGGDWCSRWRELGEDAPGCASHHTPGHPSSAPRAHPCRDRQLERRLGELKLTIPKTQVLRTINKDWEPVLHPCSLPRPSEYALLCIWAQPSKWRAQM